jgi:hypothetical protein
MRLRCGLLVQANGAGSRGQVVVPRPLLRTPSQESRVGRMEALAGHDAVARSVNSSCTLSKGGDLAAARLGSPPYVYEDAAPS